ncbi:tetratricopeptide repeat protein [Niveispirillum cyanobacteriorum]
MIDTIFSDDEIRNFLYVLSSENESIGSLADLLNLNPKSDFVNLDFSGIDFSNRDLRGFRFTGSVFTGANLSGIIVDRETAQTIDHRDAFISGENPIIIQEMVENIEYKSRLQSFLHSDNKIKDRKIFLRPNKPSAFRKDMLSASELLTARYSALSLRGRDKEMNTLLEWAQAPEPVGILLLTGPAGYGKTRLALELCRQLEQQGWLTGFLLDRLPDLSNIRLSDLFDSTRPTLITIDYAAGRMEDVRRFTGLADKWGGRLRLLLIEREAGDWWANRKNLPDPAGAMLRGPACIPDPLEVPPLPTGIPAEVFAEAAAHFASQLGISPDQIDAPTAWPDMGSPQLVHAQALLAVEAARDGTKPPTTTQDDILDHLLLREQHVWRSAARLSDSDNAKLSDIRAIVTLLTMTAPNHGDDTPVLIRRLPRLADHSGETLAQWLTALHPLYGEGDLLRGLEPDLLGEHLIWRTVTSPTDPLLIAATGPDASGAQAQTALTLLNRLAARKPEAVGWLRAILDREFSRLAVPAFRVALEQSLPMAALFRAVMDRLTFDQALTLSDLLPEYTTELREIAAQVEQRLVDLPQQPDAPPEALSFRAKHLNNLSVRLSDLGKREEALAAVEEAVAIHYTLANTRPDTFIADLATALNNLSVRLSDMGQWERALAAVEEAVNLYRTLAEKQPDSFLPDLATALNNRSSRLSDLGQRERALAAVEEAVNLYRTLAEKQPDSFLPDLATALNNRSSRLSDLGQRERALAAVEEAVSIHRTLAETRPDAFLPDLASSLNNLSVHLSALGQRERALAAVEEAVGLYRTLAETRPDAFLPDLAGALNNLSNRLSNLGQRERALAAAEEAVAIRRTLADTRPDAFLPDLALSISVLRNRLREVGRFDDALAAAREAASMLFPYFCRLPAAFGDRMLLFIRDYTQSAQEAGQEPDPALLDPIVAALIEHGFLLPPDAKTDAPSPT